MLKWIHEPLIFCKNILNITIWATDRGLKYIFYSILDKISPSCSNFSISPLSGIHTVQYTPGYTYSIPRGVNVPGVYITLTGVNDSIPGLGIRSFAHRSFRSNQMSDCEQFAQIAQDKWATVRESLRSLRGNERPWQIAQVAQDKWATVSDSLRSLMINEQMSNSLKKCWLKKS